MRRFCRLGLTGIIFVTLLGGAGASPPPGGFTYTSIDCPGATWTIALGINERGTIVGQYYDASEGRYCGFLRTREGSYSSACTADGISIDGAAGINARGDIAVGCYGGTSTCLFRDGVLTRLDIQGAWTTGPAGINQQGDVVGGYIDASWQYHGYLWRDGVSTTIDHPDGNATSARGINARGDIVGTYNRWSQGPTGFLLREGQFTDFVFPNAVATEALGNNERGDIVGDYTFDWWNTAQAFVLRNGEFTTLELPGPYTEARGINNRGQIVGTYRDEDGQHGFLAVPR